MCVLGISTTHNEWDNQCSLNPWGPSPLHAPMQMNYILEHLQTVCSTCCYIARCFGTLTSEYVPCHSSPESICDRERITQ